MDRASISERLKEAASISDAADALSISRPTLYKYMDLYDNGMFDRIPERVLDYFDSAARNYDENYTGISGSDRAKREAFSKGMREDEASSGASVAWTDSTVSTMTVSDDRGTVVFFRDAVSEGWDATVRLFVAVGGRTSEIGRFEAERRTGFVRVPLLPVGPEYQFIAEMRRGSHQVSSEYRRLSVGRTIQ